MKILVISFSYNKELEIEKKFLDQITKFQKIINTRIMLNLSLPGKIKIFTTLALSKIIVLVLLTNVPTVTVELSSK